MTHKVTVCLRGLGDDFQELPYYKTGGHVSGLKADAARVRSAGRHDDEVLVHVNHDEFEKMRKMWGDPMMNPKTGVPEWGFMDSLKKVLRKAAPILSIASLIPGMQFLSPLAALGKGVSAVTGLGSMASNAIAGATIGGITGGKRGAVMGGIGGFAGAPASADGTTPAQWLGGKVLGGTGDAATRALVGRGILGAGSAALTGRDPLTGAASAAMLGGMTDKLQSSNLLRQGLGSNPLLQQGALGALRGAELAAVTGGDYKRGAILGGASGAGHAALQRFAGEQYVQPEFVGPTNPELQSGSDLAITQMASDPSITTTPEMFASYKTKAEALSALGHSPDQRPVMDALAGFTACDASGDFGSCLAQNWDSFMSGLRKSAPTLQLKTGGMPSRMHVSEGAGDGQDDLVNARLSVDEYVIPADAVSALGSGSSQAGARALDGMVQQLRSEYRSTAPSELPPKARSPLEYMMRGAR